MSAITYPAVNRKVAHSTRRLSPPLCPICGNHVMHVDRTGAQWACPSHDCAFQIPIASAPNYAGLANGRLDAADRIGRRHHNTLRRFYAAAGTPSEAA